jgi:aryl carrier-like protein
VAHPLIAEAVVVARGDGPSGARLAGYYRVASGATAPSVAELQEFLRRGLPEYMVPPHLMVLDAFPLTPNLKIDRRALPAPELAGGDAFRAPAGPAEIALAEIWQELLGVPRVGAEDNFFALGGDSILVIQLIARARRRGLALKPHDVFLQPSLAALAIACRPLAATGDEVVHRQGVELVGSLSDEDFADLLDSYGQ